MVEFTYYVWRRSEHDTFRIWHPLHFSGSGIAPPTAADQQLMYVGGDYQRAWDTCLRANKAGFKNDDTTERIRRDNGLSSSTTFTESLFG